jgi:hypothetical protein
MAPASGLRTPDRTTSAGRAHATLALPAGIVAVLALVIGFQPMPRDPDLWFHLAGGEYVLSHWTVPDTDPFSFTKQGEPWVPHSWLFDVGVALGWQYLGPRATEAVFALVFAAAMLIVFSLLVGERRSINGRLGAATRGHSRVPPVMAMGVCLALAIAAANARGLRPQTLSLLLCVVVIAMLVRHRAAPSRRIVLIVPIVFLFWAQVHAACVMGLVVIGVWLAGRVVDVVASGTQRECRGELGTLAVVLVLSVLAVLLTPHRMTHFAYVAMTADLAALRQTQEWQSPQPLSLEIPDVYAYLLVAGVLAALARSRNRCGWAEIGLCAGTLVLAFSAVRHIPLACVAAAPLLACALGRRCGPDSAGVANDASPHAPPSPGPSLEGRGVPYPVRGGGLSALRSAGLPLVVAVLLALAVLWEYPTSAKARYAAAEPVAGARALAQLDGDWRVFTTYNTGAYVLHAAPGRLRVFIDSRADVYGDELFAAMRHAQLARGWQELFAQWDINAAVVEREDPLVDELRNHPDWRVLTEDPVAMTFIRADALPMICKSPKRPSEFAV